MEWQQVSNLPKGLNLPAGVSAEMLGLELGESYAEAKAKLQTLFNDSPAAKGEKQFSETKVVFKMPVAYSSVASPEFIGAVMVDLTTKGAGRIAERIIAKFSAPSSGHQLTGLSRRVEYFNQADQPRISELLPKLNAKFRSTPQTFDYGKTLEARFNFSRGRPFTSANPYICRSFDASLDYQPREVLLLNENRECDVQMRVVFAYGISKDHAETIYFTLGDAHRARENSIADQKFFDGYLAALRARTSGAGPKL